MYTFFLLILAGLFALIAWRDLRWGLFLIAAALPSYLLRFDLLGIPFTFLEVMILVVVAIWFLQCKQPVIASPAASGTKQSRWVRPNLTGSLRSLRSLAMTLKPWRLPILLLLLAASIGVLVSPDLTSALGSWKAYFIEPILLFLVASDVLRDESDRKRLIDALGVGAVFVALVAIAQFALDAGIPAPWDVERRVTSIFPYPNAVGLYLGPVIVLGAYALGRFSHHPQPLLGQEGGRASPPFQGGVRGGYRLFWVVTILASAIAIVLAQNEAAFVAVPGALFIASLWSNRLRRVTIPAALIVMAIVLAIPAIRTPVVQKLTLQDYSGQVRFSQWQETIELLKDKPIFGAGINGYPTALVPYHTHPEFEIFQYPHTIILNIWVELGLLGLVAFALLAWRVFKTGSQVRRFEGSKDRGSATLRPFDPFIPAAIAALLEMAIHGLVDVPYFKNDLAAMTWLILALLVVNSSHAAPPASAQKPN